MLPQCDAHSETMFFYYLYLSFKLYIYNFKHNFTVYIHTFYMSPRLYFYNIYLGPTSVNSGPILCYHLESRQYGTPTPLLIQGNFYVLCFLGVLRLMTSLLFNPFIRLYVIYYNVLYTINLSSRNKGMKKKNWRCFINSPVWSWNSSLNPCWGRGPSRTSLEQHDSKSKPYKESAMTVQSIFASEETAYFRYQLDILIHISVFEIRPSKQEIVMHFFSGNR